MKSRKKKKRLNLKKRGIKRREEIADRQALGTWRNFSLFFKLAPLNPRFKAKVQRWWGKKK